MELTFHTPLSDKLLLQVFDLSNTIMESLLDIVEKTWVVAAYILLQQLWHRRAMIMDLGVKLFSWPRRFCVFLAHWWWVHMAEAVKQNVAPPFDKVGLLHWEGDHYFRYSEDLGGGIKKVAITGGTWSPEDPMAGLTWKPIEDMANPLKEGPGESRLEGEFPPPMKSDLLKGQVLVTSERGKFLSSATVYMDCLIYCVHRTAPLQTVLIRGKNKDAEERFNMASIEMERFTKASDVLGLKWDEESMTCTGVDFQVARLTRDEMSYIGVQSLKQKDVTRNYENQYCSMAYCVSDFFDIFKEQGNIEENLDEAHDMGIAFCRINSTKGASSSPIFVKGAGAEKCVGILAGKPHGKFLDKVGKMNVFITMDMIDCIMEKLGHVTNPITQGISFWKSANPGESNDAKKRRRKVMEDEYKKNIQKWADDYAREEEAAQERAEYLLTGGDAPQENADFYRGRRARGHAHLEEDRPWERGEEEGNGSQQLDYSEWRSSGLEENEIASQDGLKETVSSSGNQNGLNENVSSAGSVVATVPQPPRPAPGLSMRDSSSSSPGESCTVPIYVIPEGTEWEALEDAPYTKWKRTILEGGLEKVCQEARNWNTDKGVRARLELALANPRQMLMRAYMDKTQPHNWKAPGRTLYGKDSKPFFSHVAHWNTSARSDKKSPKEDTSLQLAVKDLVRMYHDERKHGCVKGEYQFPENTKENCEKSLKAQARKSTAAPLDLTEDQRRELDHAMQEIEKLYAQPLEAEGFKFIKAYIEEGEAGFHKVFSTFEDKSAGVSSRFHNAKKNEWVKDHNTDLIELVLTRLMLLAIAGDDIRELSSVELVKYGLKDILNVEMKNEGHSPSKMEEERFRLIWVSSVIDCAVQALLHKADNQYYINAYQADKVTFAAFALGHNDEGIARAVRCMLDQGLYDNITSDAEAFDFSMSSEFIYGDGRRRANRIASDYVASMVQSYSHLLCSHVLHNGGDVWQVEKYGITTSGHISTTSQNTFARKVMAKYAGSDTSFNLSDDLVADTKFSAEKLKELGITSREVEPHTGEANFTSHLINFEALKAKFLNVEKCLWTLAHKANDVANNKQRFGGILYVLRNTPGAFDDLMNLCKDFNIEVQGHICDYDIANEFC